MDGSPQCGLRFDTTTLWHFDAAEWVPSTTSRAAKLEVSTTSPLSLRKLPVERTSRNRRSGPVSDIWTRRADVDIAISAASFRTMETEATVIDFTAFADMERSSWSDATRASGYVELFACASDQTIEKLIDAVGATQLKVLGHDARLMPAKYVRPYSKGQKNDFRDA